MKKSLLILFLSIFSFNVNGQVEIGIRAGAGISKMNNGALYDFYEQSLSFISAEYLGLFFKQKIGNRSSIIGHLNLNRRGIKERFINTGLYEEGDGFGEGLSQSIRRFYGLSFLIAYEYNIGRFKMNLGIENSVIRFETMKTKGYGPLLFNPEIYSLEFGFIEWEMENFNYGLRQGLAYQLTEIVTVEASYYHGLNNVFARNKHQKSKIKEWTIGVRYALATEYEYAYLNKRRKRK